MTTSVNDKKNISPGNIVTLDFVATLGPIIGRTMPYSDISLEINYSTFSNSHLMYPGVTPRTLVLGYDNKSIFYKGLVIAVDQSPAYPCALLLFTENNKAWFHCKHLINL